jgi:dipeptidyl aminopeptidase/acylaminoacyl peptidase
VATVASGGIFISYRRQETSHLAGRLYDRLANRFGDERVFMDVDTIELGVDFARVINEAVSTCAVLLAVIGPNWVTATGEDGGRRLDDPDDIVRLEVGAALERDVRVIPILVEGAAMPRRHQLPESLAPLARRNALTVRHDSFRYDVDRLVTAIERVVEAAAPSTAAGPAPTPPARAVNLGQLAEAPPVDLARTPESVQTMTHPSAVNMVAFSPDGRLLATAGDDNSARVWEVGSGRERRRLLHDNKVYGVAFSPDASLLATGSWDDTARLWDTTSWQERDRITGDTIWDVAFSSDGRLLATAGTIDVRVWEVASVREWSSASARITVWGVAFSPDDRLLASAHNDAMARVWEMASGQERRRFVHSDRVSGVAFSPDGRLLATAGDDNSARVWEVGSGRERVRLSHGDKVRTVAFSPDGRLLATGCFDDAARIWEVASGRERARLPHGSTVSSVAFSPDGRLLATGSWDATATIWSLPP